MRNLWSWTLGVALLATPLAGKSQDAAAMAQSITNAASPEAAEQSLENAPAKVVSAPGAVAPNVAFSAAAAEIVKLAQAGVDESVMLSYISNSSGLFNLESDQIVYLNDLGVPSSVVTAMIQRDQAVRTSNPSLAATPAPTMVPSVPQAPTVAESQIAPVPQAPMATAPLTPPTEYVQAPNATYTYFYDSLAPYGSWVNVEGYGMCWQPTVVAVNHDWQPYGDRGHWVNTDSGWYWASDYSWGWAPFHYGRWFRHSHFGWCWAPDTVWGPSWVSWRYADDYCGWAPLPPVACYSPGIGFTYFGRGVDVSFGFGIAPSCFTFVSIGRFCDPHPWRFREPHDHVRRFFDHTTVINHVVVGDHNRIINRGIPVDRIASSTHTRIPTVRIHDTDNFDSVRRGERFDRDGRSLTVFHPQLPEPPRNRRVVGEGVRPAPRDRNTTPIGVVRADQGRNADGNRAHNSDGSNIRNPDGHHEHDALGNNVRNPDGNHVRSPDGHQFGNTDDNSLRSPDGNHVRSPDGNHVRSPDGHQFGTTDENRSPDGNHVRSPDGHQFGTTDQNRSPDGNHVRSPDGNHVMPPTSRDSGRVAPTPAPLIPAPNNSQPVRNHDFNQDHQQRGFPPPRTVTPTPAPQPQAPVTPSRDYRQEQPRQMHQEPRTFSPPPAPVAPTVPAYRQAPAAPQYTPPSAPQQPRSYQPSGQDQRGDRGDRGNRRDDPRNR